MKNELSNQKELSLETKLSNLDTEKFNLVQSTARNIDVFDSDNINNYGGEVQKSFGTISLNLVENASSSDLDEVGSHLTELFDLISDSNPEELFSSKNAIGRLLNKVTNKAQRMTDKYLPISSQISSIQEQLELESQETLESNKALETIFELNKQLYEDLDVLILAGEMKLDELNNVIIPREQEEADKSYNLMKSQEVQDLIQQGERLQQKISDLRLTQHISLQQAPQIRVIQNTNYNLMQKINSSITTTIPLWNSQLAIALSLLRQEKVAQVTKAVSDTTNKLYGSNSKKVKSTSITVAKEMQRGVIDLATLQETQKDLMETLTEIKSIQQNGSKSRKSVESELLKLESDLKKNLTSSEMSLEYSGTDTISIEGNVTSLNGETESVTVTYETLEPEKEILVQSEYVSDVEEEILRKLD